MNKDWKGSKGSIFANMAANSHSDVEREKNDFYATHPDAIDKLLEVWQPSSNIIWECAAGVGHLSKALRGKGNYPVIATELYNRSSYIPLIDNFIEFGVDFLKVDGIVAEHIVTNPPYKYAEQFIRHALSIVMPERYVCMFLPIRYLEGQQRKKLFTEYPPLKVVVMSKRIMCAMNGEFDKYGSSAQGYAWFIWQKGIYSKTIVEWV